MVMKVKICIKKLFEKINEVMNDKENGLKIQYARELNNLFLYIVICYKMNMYYCFHGRKQDEPVRKTSFNCWYWLSSFCVLYTIVKPINVIKS